MRNEAPADAHACRALAYLFALQLRAQARKALRTLQTPRGFLLSALGVLVLGAWFAPSVYSGLSGPRTDPATLQRYWPLGMLSIILLQIATPAGELAIAFSRSEVDLLFPAPFTRRQLLAYRMVRAMTGTTLAALLMSVVFLRNAASWPASFFAVLMSWWFIQLITMAIVLVRQNLSVHVSTWSKRAVGLLLAGAAAAAFWPTFVHTTPENAVSPIRLLDAPLLRGFLAPFAIFSHIATAEQIFPQLLGWTALAFAVNAVLAGSVIWLDINYTDAAVQLSQRAFERRERMRRGSAAPMRDTIRAHRQIPMLPWLFGAGSNAWRQLTAVRRSISTVAVPVVILMAIWGFGYWRMPDDALIPLTLFSAFLMLQLAAALRFDFRSDIENMDWLKCMPLRPVQVVLGELAAPVILMTLLELPFLGMAAIMESAPRLCLAALPWAIVLNTVVIATENLMFLLYPHPIAAGPGDMQMVGRQFLSLLAKMLATALCLVVGASCGVSVMWLTGHRLLSVATAWLAVAVAAAAMVAATAWAFTRFDPSRDAPVG